MWAAAVGIGGAIVAAGAAMWRRIQTLIQINQDQNDAHKADLRREVAETARHLEEATAANRANAEASAALAEAIRERLPPNTQPPPPRLPNRRQS
jgi:small-conductance mechanosensitive channel